MNTDLRGKKLLILGGNALSCDIVQTAQSMGVYTIVTDWNEPSQSPAKLIANEYWNISLMDYDLLTEKIREKRVNGVITGFTDSYLLPYQHLCEINDFPCYATKQQLEQTLDKGMFKSFCRESGIDVVPQYDLKTFNKHLISDSHKIIIKPVDNSGSRGICLCKSAEDFEAMLQYSLSYSQKKEVVLEKYMECDDVSFEYKIQDGEVFLSSICDRYIYKTKNAGSVTSKLIYPSRYTEDFMKETDGKVRQMFQQLGLQNGVLFMQAFVENGHFYFYEMGYRLSGGRHYLFTDNQNGTNAAKELIQFALTGKMSDKRLTIVANPKFKDVCCQLSILCRSEMISKIVGVDLIEKIPEIIDMKIYHHEGESIGKEGTTAQIFARIHVVAKSKTHLDELIQMIKKTLIVTNTKGDNIIINTF